MAPRKVLFATDFSPASAHALPVATSIARDRDAVLLIAHVSELEHRPVGELFDDVPELDEDPPPNPKLAAQLEQIRPTDESVPFEHRMLYGKPAEAIVRSAEKENVETIILGTHGYRGLTRALAGSVAEEVILEAPCPVIAVRAPKAAKYPEPKIPAASSR